MSEVSNALYPKCYGAWAGLPAGHKPDFKRCCTEVASRERWTHFSQCNRPRGHGPDGAYCKQHDPEAVKTRQAATDVRAEAAWQKRRLKYGGKTFFDALVQIAEGHNDARGLAQEIIDAFKKT